MAKYAYRIPIIIIPPEHKSIECAVYVNQSRKDYDDQEATLRINGYKRALSEISGVSKFVK